MFTATAYGLDACGLTTAGSKRFTTQLLQQIRIIVKDPVHLTHHTHEQLLHTWGLTHPLDMLRNQLLAEPEQDPDDPFARGPGSAAWKHVIDSICTTQREPVELTPLHKGTVCPECGITYVDRTAILLHMAKAHPLHSSRPTNQSPIFFERARDAQKFSQHVRTATKNCVTSLV